MNFCFVFSFFSFFRKLGSFVEKGNAKMGRRPNAKNTSTVLETRYGWATVLCLGAFQLSFHPILQVFLDQFERERRSLIEKQPIFCTTLYREPLPLSNFDGIFSDFDDFCHTIFAGVLYSRKFSSGIWFRRCRQSNFLTKRNSWLNYFTNHKCKIRNIFVNVKINNKQKSDDWTIEEQTSDGRHLTKIIFLTNCLTVAFDEIFRWRKFPAIHYPVGMRPLRTLHSFHDFATQSSHSVDLAGWQAKWLPLKSGYHDEMCTSPIELCKETKKLFFVENAALALRSYLTIQIKTVFFYLLTVEFIWPWRDWVVEFNFSAWLWTVEMAVFISRRPLWMPWAVERQLLKFVVVCSRGQRPALNGGRVCLGARGHVLNVVL